MRFGFGLGLGRRRVTVAAAGGDAYYTAESLGSQSVPNPYGALLSLTESLAAGEWVGFWNFDSVLTSNAVSTNARIVVDGVNGAAQRHICKEPTSPPDRLGFGGMFFVTGDGSSKTFTIEGQASTANMTASNARLSLVKLGADDETASSIAAQSFTDPGNKTAQTAASLAFTPPSSGDYLIVCTALIALTNASNVQMTVELTDGTTTTGAIEMRPSGTNTEKYPITLLLPLSAISGSKTISFKVRQSGSGATTIETEDIRILALRLDRFANAYSSVLGSTNSGTDTSYTAALSYAPTVAAGDHLTLASGFFGNNSFGNTPGAEFTDGGSQVAEALRENFLAALRYEQLMAHRIATYTAGSRTFAINRKTESGTGSVAAGSCIAVLDLTGLS